MDLGLRGKVAVVTGGSKGIGYAAAKVFLEEGAKVAICARHEEELRQAAGELEQLGPVYWEAVDVTDAQANYDFAEHVYRHFPRLWLLRVLTAVPVPESLGYLHTHRWGIQSPPCTHHRQNRRPFSLQQYWSHT